MEICDTSHCTGCGMCSNICPNKAIEMTEMEHGFIYPQINIVRCTKCGLCIKKCPSNTEKKSESTIKKTYAAWNTIKLDRKKSTSGGICSLIENEIFNDGGVVVGVEWQNNFCPKHAIATNEKHAENFRGSKYVQSNTYDIYNKVKELLNVGKRVFFSGTPCQVAALKSYLGKDYKELFIVDFVCHGVPSYKCLKKYLDEISIKYGKSISNVRFRYKSPYWDYCNVRIDFSDGMDYQKSTVDDPYFTLFNIGYTLRDSCHSCKYCTVNREGDITLADFWGYQPSCFKMRNYNKGVSVVAINTPKGEALFNKIKSSLKFESVSMESAMKTNKSFSEPYVVPKDKLEKFWKDYELGLSIENLCKKYIQKPFKVPSLLFLRRLKKRYGWIIKHK